MAGAAVTVQATGFSHPPGIQPVQRRPGAQVEWHKSECPIAVASVTGEVPTGKCLDHPLQSGCAAPPKPEEQ